MTGICGSCTMCCKLLGIEELDKPSGCWCKHRNATGCRIYDARPQSCQTYECVYYTWVAEGQPVPPELRPDRCHVIIDCQKDGRTHHVRPDPGYPDAWRRAPVFGVIVTMVNEGFPVYLVRGETRKQMH